MNEEFEKWAVDNGHDILCAPSWANTRYQSLPCEDAWRAWQASRKQALEEAFKVCQTKMGARGCEHGIRELMKD